MSTDTITQRTITVPTDGQQIVVRRMKWKAARAFLKKLANHLSTAGVDLQSVIGKLPEIVGNVDELATDLVINSSDLKAEDLDKLDLIEATQVLAAAVKLNLGADLKNSFADIVANLGAMMPAKLTSLGEGSTPS